MLSQEQITYVRAFADENGHIDPDLITAEARKDNSIIHGLYEWDVQKAAETTWRETSRQIIRFVRITSVVNKESVIHPLYVVDPERPPKSRRYVDVTVAKKNAETARQILLDELDRIAQAITRAITVAAALGLSAELEAMLANVMTIREHAEERRKERNRNRRKRGRAA